MGHVLFHQINFMKKEPIKIKIPTFEEKITKIKLQMNEHEIYTRKQFATSDCTA